MSNYFTFMPTLSYDIEGKLAPKELIAKNIFMKMNFSDEVLDQTLIYYKYSVGDNERADVISYNYYGHVKYTWLIYLVNNIIDPIAQWPKSNKAFTKYLKRKYGSVSVAKDEIHHYEKIVRNSKGVQTGIVEIDFDTYQVTAPDIDKKIITTYDWEYNENETFREIDLLEDVYVQDVYNEFKTVTKQTK